MTQIIIAPLSTPLSSKCFYVNLYQDSIYDLKKLILIEALGVRNEDKLLEITQNLQIYHDGKPLFKEHAPLIDYNIRKGDTLRIRYSLKGGIPIKLKVKTEFGCTSCAQLFVCTTCPRGRTYEVETDTIRNTSDIITQLELIEPLWKQKKPKTHLISGSHQHMEKDRKIIFYDLKDNDTVFVQLPPMYFFYSAFRSVPRKTKAQLLEDPEMQKYLEELRAKKGKEASDTVPVQCEESDNA